MRRLLAGFPDNMKYSSAENYMTKLRFLLAAILATFTLPLQAALPAARPLKVPVLQYEKYTLPNGLTVILHQDHRLPLVAVDLWYHVGPVNERPGRTGFAHLFEHMMFQGSEHVGEKAHFKYLEGAGATGINGTTEFDRTNYFETLPASELELGLWLESDRMGFLLETLDRTKLANQRDVVRNERRQSEGSPYSLAEEQVYQSLFPAGHPYYAAVIGSHTDIESARLNDVRDFFKSYYTPNNASIAIAGDFDPARVKALVAKYFGPIARGPAVEKVTAVTPAITSERRSVVTDTVQLPRVSMAWLTPIAFTAGDAEAGLFTAILGGGKSSRLNRKLVYEQQIAQSANCANDSLTLASVTICDVTARPGVEPKALEAAINKEVDSLRQDGPTAAELERARNVHLSRIINGLQRLGGFGGVADLMDRYNQYLGDPGYLPKDIARIQHVTIASLKKVAGETFAANQRVVVYTVKGKKVLNDVPRSPENTDADVKLVNPYTPEFETQQNWRKTPPTGGPLSALKLPVPATFALSNGMKVYLLEDHSLPVLSASLVTKAGNEAAPEGKAGLAAFTARMLTEGTASRSSTQLAEDAASIGAQLQSNANMDKAQINIDALSNNTAAGLELLADVALHPVFKDEEVERIRKQRLGEILQEGDQPIAALLRVGQKALYGDQPYGFTNVGTTQSVTATTQSDLKTFWSGHYGPQTAALVLAGDVTQGEAKSLAEKYFGGWSGSAQGAAVSLPPAPSEPARRFVIVDKPGSPQTALYAIGFGVPRDTPEYPAIIVLNKVLGGLFSSRINMNLREKHGYTYGGSSNFSFLRAGGPFFAGARVRTDVTAPAAQELVSELQRIRTDPPSTSELKLAQENALRSLPAQFETVGGIAQMMSDIFIYGLPLDYYQKLPAKFAAVTSDQVAKAAQDDVHPENVIIVAVGDRAKIESSLQKLNLGAIEIRDAGGDLVKK